MKTVNKNSAPYLKKSSISLTTNDLPGYDSPNGNQPEELLSALFHDLRSPLGAISVITDIMSQCIEMDRAVEPRQFLMLQDAVNKAQRILDDGLEMQSIMRGSSTFSFSTLELKTFTQNCLDKARHAPYFRNIRLHYDKNSGEMLVRIDVEKAESVLFCVLEQMARLPETPTELRVTHEICGDFACVILSVHDEINESLEERTHNPNMKGRLGTRKLGESRYNLYICAQVLHQMGGELEMLDDRHAAGIRIKLPLAQI